jgi:hypothetical protein
VANDGVHLREAFSHFGRDVLAQLDSVVAAFLLRRQLLVENVFAQANPDLDRESRARILN